MSKGLFVTATGIGVGKTYVSALIVKLLRENGVNCGYYKAAVSGAESISKSDAGYVNQFANIGQDQSSLLSYRYTTPVSPHLAANIEGNPVELSKIKEDYKKVCDTYDFVLTEGSGGIVCPIRYDEEQKIMLEDIIRILGTPVLIIADEIATGFGRTGKMFACDHADISPDIICLSKGLTGGYMPMALTVTTQRIYDAFYTDYNEGKAFMHSHTYSGNPLSCSAALAVLDIIKNQNIMQNANETADYLNKRIVEVFGNHKNVGEVRSIELTNAIELVSDKNNKTGFDGSKRVGYQIYKKALSMGLILRPLDNVIYFNPPLTIKPNELDKAISIAQKAVDAILT